LSKELEVIADCASCGGTGAYHGFAEPEGVVIVCLSCGGSGQMHIKYTPFIGRKLRIDIQVVRLVKGSFTPTRENLNGQEISYHDFMEGKLPAP